MNVFQSTIDHVTGEETIVDVIVEHANLGLAELLEKNQIWG
jgi:hypothetical protein